MDLALGATDNSCPDPGVLKDGDTHYMVCTPGCKYLLRSSKDLVHWKKRGTVFTTASCPSWAKSHFWAPELHKVANKKYVVYFSARIMSQNTFAIGTA